MAHMAGESSFDIVSKVDHQEVDNALNMAAKEVRNRFDFKGTDSSIKWSGEAIEMEANGEDRVKAILDVFQTMLVRRKIDLLSLDAGEARLSGKMWKITATTKEGLSRENASKITKLIRDAGFKGVRTQVQGEELRVFGKKRDELQAVQKLVREADNDFAVQFDNYR
jgi:cyclic-di-GMP-binding protein